MARKETFYEVKKAAEERPIEEIYKTVREKLIASLSETKEISGQFRVDLGEYYAPGLAVKELLFGVLPIDFAIPAKENVTSFRFPEDRSKLRPIGAETCRKPKRAGYENTLFLLGYSALENRPEVFADLMIGGVARFYHEDGGGLFWHKLFAESLKYLPREDGYRWPSLTNLTFPLCYSDWESEELFEKSPHARTADEVFEAVMGVINAFPKNRSFRVILDPRLCELIYGEKTTAEPSKKEVAQA